ncbi:aminopeptidase P family protein [Pedobacter sp. SD-b]|uniref:Xaa-Pro aminopeptidase n=1 Tax=Pedobacter segetis TaxID=2793069 RepID=A0ABS1BJV1_9SPHI|nr:aminopeptidase P family protein [Pedobacter segetis]MBK0383155.1 aminopeptidase P family protein [Pedobacter segetis]
MKVQIEKNELFKINRKNFSSRIKKNAVAIINSNDEFPRSGDQIYNFKQNPDFFYLSGIDQEQSILIIFPDCPNPLYREVLFLRQTNEHIAIWEGHKYTIEEARAISGIENIYWVDEFWNILSSVIHYATHIYINTNENDRYAPIVPYKDLRFINEIKSRYPLHHYERAALIFRELRPIKSDFEVAYTQKACDITKDAFKRVLKFVKPGVKEYEIEAEIIHEFIKQQSTGHAYSPIIAAGKNACVLHYNDNKEECKDGEVILFDFGAEYANYNADMSRSIPVNGKFTKRQKDVYNAVLHVMKEATKMLVSGTIWNDYHEEVGKIMTSELIKLGLLDKHDVEKQNPKMPAYKKYFMHGTSHHLGLDVHDFASRYQPFALGNILTCEPGIYILNEGLGIRLENNILITKDGPVDLMANIPIEADEIEEIMNS